MQHSRVFKMSSSNVIEKIAVSDPRIVQDAPAYAVHLGAAAVSVQQFQAVSQTTSQHTFQVQVPSLNVFVDRKVLWSCQTTVTTGCMYSGPVTYNSGAGIPYAIPVAFTSIPIIGCGHQALCAFPLQKMCTNMTASINDATVTTNGDTLQEQIMLSNTRANLRQRTTPSKLDQYANNFHDAAAPDGNIGFGWGGAYGSDLPNSSWPITFLDNTGAPLVGTGTYSSGFSTTTVVNYVNGVPVWIAGMDATLSYPIYFRFTVTEPLLISPFLWQDSLDAQSTGLYGVTNIQLTMNMQTPANYFAIATQPTPPSASGRINFSGAASNPAGANLIRTDGAFTIFSSVVLNNPSSSASSPFANSKLILQFLTPGTNVSLPEISNVPYMEFPRYISPYTLTGGPIFSGVTTNAITLSSIPDSLVIYAKPTLRLQTQGDFYIPITNCGVTFNNYSNLCSGFTPENLYESTVAAGLDVPYLQWRGALVSSTMNIPVVANVAASGPLSVTGAGVGAAQFSGSGASTSGIYASGAVGVGAPLTGAPLVLRMGRDVTLSSGLAPGCLGNYSLQLNLTLDTTNLLTSGVFAENGVNTLASVNIYVIAVTSGFFETVRGASAVRKTILNAADVTAAHTESGVTHSQLARLVGGGHTHMLSADAGSLLHSHSARLGRVVGGGASGGGMSGGGGAADRYTDISDQSDKQNGRYYGQVAIQPFNKRSRFMSGLN